MKFQVATRYILIHQLISLGIFFIWWILFGILFPVFGLYFSGSSDPVSSDVLIPIVFFSIIISFLSMNSDFKFFIQCGLKRFSIFIVNLSAIAISSLLSSIIALLLSKISVDKFNLTIFLISKDAYHSDNFLLSLLLVFILLFFFSSLGLVLGTFNDIFSGFKKIIILLLVMSIPIVLSILIQLGNSAMKNKWFNFLKSIIGYSREKGFSPLPFITTLFIGSIVLLFLFYFMNRSHEVRRKGV
ncbi:MULTISPECIES: ABC transporter permease [Lactococcus]|uniref:Uncharacterized protein n=1 Tax=Lactococcus lactis subsp. lactis TaxID=1360 RepID=A0A0V8CN15_LACLL|nr:ABC transporter permease [Lactococcus lactis]KSU02527.1 hypothetical protein KF282_2321 [Lactococcus lactis subsp. lactis]WEA55962.1 ABC transporter permease [Lactococcus lactis]